MLPSAIETTKETEPMTKRETIRIAKPPSAQSKYEAEFDLQLRAVKITDYVPELRFHLPRKFRFDFAFPHLLFAVEIEGVTYDIGRHQRKAGYEKDLEKYTIAMLDGWIVYRCSGASVTDGTAITNTLHMLRYLENGDNRSGIRGDSLRNVEQREFSRQRIGESDSAQNARKPAKKRGKSDTRDGRKGSDTAKSSNLKPAIAPTQKVKKLITDAKSARLMRDAAQKHYDAIIDKLKDHIGDAVGVDQLVEWMGRERMMVDQKKLKAEFPDVYAQVANARTDRPFKILDNE
jgi:hypothetical protein